MTADDRTSGEGNGGSLLSTLRKLKEHWLLIVAMVSALFWIRDTVEMFARLPADVATQRRMTEDLDARLSQVEAVVTTGSDGDGDQFPVEDCARADAPGEGAERSRRAFEKVVRDCPAPWPPRRPEVPRSPTQGSPRR